MQALRMHNSDADNTEPTNFGAYLLTLDPWEREILNHFVMAYPPREVMERLNQGPITAASDGSVRQDVATFGVVITDYHEE